MPAANLSPRYGLVTATITDDSDGLPASVTATAYDAPHLGLPTAVTQDPGGLNLTTATAYEPGGYHRRTSRTLPAGNTWTYAYYGGAQNLSLPGAPQAWVVPPGVSSVSVDAQGAKGDSWYGVWTGSASPYDAPGGRGGRVQATWP